MARAQQRQSLAGQSVTDRSNIQDLAASANGRSWVQRAPKQLQTTDRHDAQAAEGPAKSPLRESPSFRQRRTHLQGSTTSVSASDVLVRSISTPRPPNSARLSGSFHRSPSSRTPRTPEAQEKPQGRECLPEHNMNSLESISQQKGSGDSFRRGAQASQMAPLEVNKAENALSPTPPQTKPQASPKRAWTKARNFTSASRGFKQTGSVNPIRTLSASSVGSAGSVQGLSPQRRLASVPAHGSPCNKVLSAPDPEDGGQESPPDAAVLSPKDGSFARRKSSLASSPVSPIRRASIASTRTNSSSTTIGSRTGSNDSTASDDSSAGILDITGSPTRVSSNVHSRSMPQNIEPWHQHTAGEFSNRFQARRRSSIFSRKTSISIDESDVLRMSEASTVTSSPGNISTEFEEEDMEPEDLDSACSPSPAGPRWGFFSRMLLLTSNPFLVPGSDFPELVFHDLELEDLQRIDMNALVSVCTDGRNGPESSDRQEEQERVAECSQKIYEFTQNGPFSMSIMEKFADTCRESRKQLSTLSKKSKGARKESSEADDAEGEEKIRVRTLFGTVTMVRAD